MSDSDVDSLSPEEAFALLGNETRIAILRALWESANDPVPFSELRETVGVRDSGQFNYHLGKLAGRFIRKTEEGYLLSFAGFQVLGAIVAGTFTESGSLDPIELDDPCPTCGGTLVARYEDERVTLGCRDCGTDIHAFSIPPGALEGYDREELPFVFDRFMRSLVEQSTLGFCVSCLGRMTPSLVVADGEASARYDCARCPERIVADLGSVLLSNSAVVRFHDEHGIDLRREPSWRLDWLHADHAEPVAEEPARARATVELGGDRLHLTVDESLSVVDVERD